jgi:glycosyltransferase involved in cell wall biosynthesis
MRTLALICPWLPPERSAVTDYLAWVVQGLSRWTRVHVVLLGDGPPAIPGCERVWSVPDTLDHILSTLEQIDPFRTVLQYSPFLWNRRGFDLLGPQLARRLAKAGHPADVVFHELWVPFGPRLGLMVRGVFHRLVVAMMAGQARRVIVTSRERIGEVQRCLFTGRDRVRMIPLASLIAVANGVDRAAVRGELGVEDGELLLCMLGFDHDSKPTDGVVAVWKELQMAGIRSRLLLIGDTRVPVREEMAHWIVAPGYCAAPRASALLQASDLFLAPLTDGVSSRRTSVAAAMAHGVPVVSTRGHHTDSGLYTDAVMELPPTGDEPAFARAVLALARSPERRLTLARQARQLYATRLDWEQHWAALREVHEL